MIVLISSGRLPLETRVGHAGPDKGLLASLAEWIALSFATDIRNAAPFLGLFRCLSWLSRQYFITCVANVLICTSTISSYSSKKKKTLRAEYSCWFIKVWQTNYRPPCPYRTHRPTGLGLWFEWGKTCCKAFWSKSPKQFMCVQPAVNLLPGGELGALREELGLGASLELQASVWMKAPSSCRRLWIRLYSWRRFWKICSVGRKQKQRQQLLKTGTSPLQQL